MRALLASFVMLGLAVTGSANCALAMPVVEAAETASHASPAGHSPCHEPAPVSHDNLHPALHGDEACQGGAACIDCALAAGLSVDASFVDGVALHGAPRLFAVKTALPVIAAHDPPPPRT
ncbi:hypothetical protein AB6B38_11215 [Glycocaulis abyssi]|uniref:Uncharacterized protein n=1 Tax=Glycocaulis abyssi TaxID=1433403 RepID=A0ABV9NFI8_9PROT